VLGGGISGLTTAFYLKRTFPDVKLSLLERSSRLGGWIRSSLVNGNVVEHGPLAFRSSNADGMQLLRDLDLEKRVIRSSAASSRYLYHHGKLRNVSMSMPYILTPFMIRLGVLLLMEPFKKKNSVELDESIASFVNRRLDHHFLKSLVEPLMLGIYGGNCAKLSARSCLPAKIVEAEKNNRSILEHMLSSMNWMDSMKKTSNAPATEMVSIQGGLQVLVDRLGNALGSRSMMLNTTAASLQFDKDKAVVVLSNGQSIECDYVFSALPSSSLAALVPDAAVATALRSIPSVSLAVVSIIYTDPAVRTRLKDGYGYLIAPQERQLILGVSFDSIVFPEHKGLQGNTIISVKVGGDVSVSNPFTVDVEHESEEYIKEIAVRSVAAQLGITAQPAHVLVDICKEAIPQYHVGHQEVVEDITERISKGIAFAGRLFVTGHSYNGVGIANCISEAKKLACNFKPSKQNKV